MVERPEAEALDPQREQVERQVVQLGNQIAVAAEQLVVALAAVLSGASCSWRPGWCRVRSAQLTRADAADLLEAGVGQALVHQHIGGDAQKPRHRRVRVDRRRPGGAPARRPVSVPVMPSDGPVYPTTAEPEP